MAVDIDKFHFKEIKSEAQAENFTLQISSTNNLINEAKKTASKPFKQ